MSKHKTIDIIYKGGKGAPDEFYRLIKYIFVGGIATIVDWALLYVLTSFFGIYHLISNIVSFIAGLIVNYCLSKKIVFLDVEPRVGRKTEFIGYAVIGMLGLIISGGVMYLLTDIIGLFYMVSKVFASLVSLLWNYVARKKLLYKS